MSIIYCSACADTSSLSGASCLHCGAVARESYELTGQNFIVLAAILALSIATVWGFAGNGAAASHQPNASDIAPANYPAQTSADSEPDRVAQTKAPAPQRANKHRDA